MVNLIFYALINTIVCITPIRVPSHVEVTELAVAMLLKLVPRDSEAHVVLSHIYATSGLWDMVTDLRCLMKEKWAGKKETGFTWIQIGSRVHSFAVADSAIPACTKSRRG